MTDYEAWCDSIARDEIERLKFSNDRLRSTLELVLLFHSGGVWDEEKAKKWERATGGDDATTRALCDHIRRVLAAK